jgi:hypothetical protein
MQDALQVNEKWHVTVDTQVVNPEVASFHQLKDAQKHSEAPKEARGLCL